MTVKAQSDSSHTTVKRRTQRVTKLPGMEVQLLGPTLVLVGGQTLVLASGRERAVLTALALRPGGVVSPDRLQVALWGDEPPSSARKAIQMYVSSLRRALPPDTIRTAPGGYALAVEPAAVDVTRFEDLVRRGRARAGDGAPGRAEALALFEAAGRLWRGRPLADLADHPDAEGEIRRLEELRCGLEEDLADLRLAEGQHHALIGELEAAVGAEPLRERRWAQLMLALYRSGRQADALRAYRRLRDLLGEELGIDPSAELVALDRAILEQSPALDLPAAPVAAATGPPEPERAATPAGGGTGDPVPPAREVPRPRHNLVDDLTSFVGRERELADIERLLDEVRLLTLSGPGGCGKTRLAREAAARVVAGGRHRDGIWFVDLTPLTGPDLVPATVAAVLGLQADAAASATAADADAVAAALAGRDLLLVLDNCEHVVAGVAAFVARLLPRAPGVRVLATSREVLGVPGERAWAVPSLSLPDLTDELSAETVRHCEAMALFASRMALPRPVADLDDTELAAMAHIVHRLDGIPLAIELAAARTAVLSLAQLADRLDDRFRVLASNARTALPRHRTLAAALEWSHDLLDPVEQAAFRRLAVFAGAFELDAAEAVVADDDRATADPAVNRAEVLDLVESLVAKSLVTVEPTGDELRYRLLETLRAFAAERLAREGDADRRHHAHLTHFAALAGRAEPELEGPRAEQWLDRLEADHDNLRAALTWAAESGRMVDGLAAAVALRTFWDVRGHLAEGRRWLERFEAAVCPPAGTAPAGEGGELCLRAALFAGELAARQGDLDGADAHYRRAETAARAAGARWCVARVLHSRAALAGLRGHYPMARALLDECLAVARELNDPRLLARGYGNLGWIAVQQGDLPAAEPALQVSLAGFRALGDLQGVAWLLQYLGDLARNRGDLPTARRLLEESFDLRIELGDKYGLSATLVSLAACLDEQDDRTGADVLRVESDKLRRELGDRHLGPDRRAWWARRGVGSPPAGGGRGVPAGRGEGVAWSSSTVATTTS
jgi:predicted ATPase/DNA-binding SARP family transcriptional activator